MADGYYSVARMARLLFFPFFLSTVFISSVEGLNIEQINSRIFFSPSAPSFHDNVMSRFYGQYGRHRREEKFDGRYETNGINTFPIPVLYLEKHVFPVVDMLRHIFVGNFPGADDNSAYEIPTVSADDTLGLKFKQDPAAKTNATSIGAAVKGLPPPNPMNTTDSGAAANSTAYQEFKKNRPRHPAFPNSQDRQAQVYLIGFIFLFVASWSVAALFFLDAMARYSASFRPTIQAMIPFAIPPLIVWAFSIGVVSQTWANPVRDGEVLNENVFTNPDYSICSEMIGYLIVGVLFAMADSAVQIYYRFKPSIELRSFALCALLADLGIQIWGAWISWNTAHWSYCSPLLTYTVFIFNLINWFCLVAFSSLVICSFLWVFIKKKKENLHHSFDEQGNNTTERSHYLQQSAANNIVVPGTDKSIGDDDLRNIGVDGLGMASRDLTGNVNYYNPQIISFAGGLNPQRMMPSTIQIGPGGDGRSPVHDPPPSTSVNMTPNMQY